eukprot:8901488-Pyramimonas_sp.AAC.1
MDPDCAFETTAKLQCTQPRKLQLSVGSPRRCRATNMNDPNNTETDTTDHGNNHTNKVLELEPRVEQIKQCTTEPRHKERRSGDAPAEWRTHALQDRTRRVINRHPSLHANLRGAGKPGGQCKRWDD